jgi:hypothetical protein
MIRNQYRPAAQPQGRTPRQSCAPSCLTHMRDRLIDRIADDMRVFDGSGISITAELLAGRTGASPALIARLAPVAAKRARRASVRSVVR